MALETRTKKFANYREQIKEMPDPVTLSAPVEHEPTTKTTEKEKFSKTSTQFTSTSQLSVEDLLKAHDSFTNNEKVDESSAVNRGAISKGVTIAIGIVLAAITLLVVATILYAIFFK